MTKHRNHKPMSLLQRCLRDVKTGKLWLSAADRHRYQKQFGELGLNVSGSFNGKEALLSAWFQSLPLERGIVLYELARLDDPSLPPLVTDLDGWPKAEHEEYLLLRIQAKLHHLFDTSEIILAWLKTYLRGHGMALTGTGEYDGEIIVEIDQTLTELIEEKSAATEIPSTT